ncbi:MAG: TonB C-terminal domain-containing protein [Sulfuricella sp.]
MVFRREEPGQMKAGALALLVHALFLGLMIFGVSWQNKEPAAVEVELWNSLPNVESNRPQQRPTPKPEPKPEPKPKPKPEPKPKVVKPEPQPEAKPSKAEIELKAKEARRKEEEQKKLKEEEVKQQKEKLKQEQEKKLQQEKAEKVRQQQAQAEADKALKAQAAARNAAAQSMVGDFKSRIQAKIKSKIILPPDLAGNPAAEFDVTLMPTGEILNLKLTRGSGSSAYDSAVERAIYKAQPLPLPPDPTLFGEFRELHLKFRLHED